MHTKKHGIVDYRNTHSIIIINFDDAWRKNIDEGILFITICK